MKTIAKQYIDEAARIRTRYLEVTGTFDKQVTELERMQKAMESIQGDVNVLDETPMSDDMKYQGLMNTVVQLEKAYLQMQQSFLPYQEEMEQLKKDADTLYHTLTERYPDLTDADLRQILERSYAEMF